MKPLLAAASVHKVQKELSLPKKVLSWRPAKLV